MREPTAWRPSAGLESLRRRARLLATLRRFFAERGVLEVETPQLSAAGATDLHLSSFSCRASFFGDERRLYLQTSPELAMKRLLAAHGEPIYQICKVFRDGEMGRLHNPEFTLLEWYRPGFDHHRLMDEMDVLLSATLSTDAAERITYGELFTRHLGFDPHLTNAEELAEEAAGRGLETESLEDADVDTWLALLLTHLIEPHLGRGRPTFVYDYPASQAALARLSPGDPAVAERFEVYVEGVELANGFHELTDAAEQRRRFEADVEARRAAGLPPVPMDERFLAALEAGLPACAGVALGVDRLAMLAAGAEHIEGVLAFAAARA